MENEELELNEYGFYTVINKPSKQELSDYYSQKYYQEGKGSYEIEYSKEEISYFKNKIRERYFVIEQNLKSTSKKFLDIGSGEGWALDFFKNEGWSVKGLDFSDFGCQKFNDPCVQFMVTGDVYENLNTIIDSNETYDVVWLDNVLEHVLDPVGLIKDIKKIIEPGGILVIEVPNDFSTLQEYLLEKGKISDKFWICLPDHLSYFNKQGLNNLMSGNGYNVIDFLGDYPIDVNLLNENSNYINNKQLGKSCHLERIEFENLIHENEINKVVDFYRSMGNLGLGRLITGFYSIH